MREFLRHQAEAFRGLHSMGLPMWRDPRVLWHVGIGVAALTGLLFIPSVRNFLLGLLVVVGVVVEFFSQLLEGIA